MDLTTGEIWKIQDDIKFRRVHFYEGDGVMLFSKRTDGYPKFLKVGDYGVVTSVEQEHLIIDFRKTYGNFIDTGHGNKAAHCVKLPKKYFVERVYLRELKLNQLFNGK